MLPTLCKLGLLTLLVIAPALPDIIDVSVTGSVSGSGDVSVCEPLPPAYCFVGVAGPVLTTPYSFSAANTQLGPFSDSGSANGSSRVGSAQAGSYANQDAEATSDSIGISISGGHFSSGIPYLWHAFENDTITVDFQLTQESTVYLRGGAFATGLTPADTGDLLDSGGNIIVSVPNSFSGVSTMLEPGNYALTTSLSRGAEGTYLNTGNVTDFNLGLSANFTAVPTPEPEGLAFAALLGIWVARRRRQSHISG